MQSDLVRLSKEVVTGRMADVGLNLGGATGRTVTLRIDKDYLATLAASNTTVTSRLEQTQTALGQLATSASEFRARLISSGSTINAAVIRQAGQSALSAFIAQANASDCLLYTSDAADE